MIAYVPMKIGAYSTHYMLSFIDEKSGKWKKHQMDLHPIELLPLRPQPCCNI